MTHKYKFFLSRLCLHIEQHGNNPSTSYSIQHVNFNLIWMVTFKPLRCGYFHVVKLPPTTFRNFHLTARCVTVFPLYHPPVCWTEISRFRTLQPDKRKFGPAIHFDNTIYYYMQTCSKLRPINCRYIIFFMYSNNYDQYISDINLYGENFTQHSAAETINN